MNNFRSIVLVLGSCLAGCSSSSTPSTDSSSNDAVLTGTFAGNAIEGLSYTTKTQTGTTNIAGEYQYIDGESIVFSVGTTELPSIPASRSISLVDFAAGSQNFSATSGNIAWLIHSLDVDGVSGNNLKISPEAAASSAPINFDVYVEEFKQNTDVINLVANSGSVFNVLIDKDDSDELLHSSLAQYEDSEEARFERIKSFVDSSPAGQTGVSYLLNRGNGTSVSYELNTDEECYVPTEYELISWPANAYIENVVDAPAADMRIRVYIVSNGSLLVSFLDNDDDDMDGDTNDTVYIRWPAERSVLAENLPLCS